MTIEHPKRQGATRAKQKPKPSLGHGTFDDMPLNSLAEWAAQLSNVTPTQSPSRQIMTLLR
jgi:hypothetical protein